MTKRHGSVASCRLLRWLPVETALHWRWVKVMKSEADVSSTQSSSVWSVRLLCWPAVFPPWSTPVHSMCMCVSPRCTLWFSNFNYWYMDTDHDSWHLVLEQRPKKSSSSRNSGFCHIPNDHMFTCFHTTWKFSGNTFVFFAQFEPPSPLPSPPLPVIPLWLHIGPLSFNCCFDFSFELTCFNFTFLH